MKTEDDATLYRRNLNVTDNPLRPKLLKKDTQGRVTKVDNIKPEEVYDASAYDPDLLPPYQIYEPIDYRDGPEGFIRWCEENVYLPIYPEGNDIAVWTSIKNLSPDIHPKSGKSYDFIWQAQKEVFRQCLRMVRGRFIYRLIILSWMRGEGKSLAACLIQLWKFFNWPKQDIVLGANSKDQIKFVHYDIIRNIIKNSPNLLDTIGDRNVQEKEIRLMDKNGNVTSVIRAISSFSGIVSNITGYTFSEIFDMKKPNFFVQLDGSIRNIPNALGVIDSTVSPKTHVLYKMYQSFITRKTKTLYFSYRCSPKADIADYWNPNMDQQQLDDYREKFPMGDFDKYFKNTWSSSAEQVFSAEMIESIAYFGVDNKVTPQSEVMVLIDKQVHIKGVIEELTRKGIPSAFTSELCQIADLKARLFPVESIYSLRDRHSGPKGATLEDLEVLSDLYDTNWAILIGIDRADPLKKDRTAARTIVTTLAKGLPGSRTNFLMADSGNPQYMYVVLNVVHVGDSLLEGIKNEILNSHEIFDGVDAITGERWGLWDLAPWCESNDIAIELLHPSYDKQKMAFSEFHGAISSGRFKCPPTVIYGSKGDDIVREELAIFYHDEDRRWFGSPEKNEKYGTQDDSLFALAWGLYGGRDLKSDDFKSRNEKKFWGTMVQNNNTLQAKLPNNRRIL